MMIPAFVFDEKMSAGETDWMQRCSHSHLTPPCLSLPQPHHDDGAEGCDTAVKTTETALGRLESPSLTISLISREHRTENTTSSLSITIIEIIIKGLLAHSSEAIRSVGVDER